jgi:quinoprotein glucose dehydrogenase
MHALQSPDVGWPSYGNDPAGTRYSPLADITPANVGDLELAWETHSRDSCGPGRGCGTTSAFELTPPMIDGSLYACTPFNDALALDPGTGEVRWHFDAGLDLSGRHANQLCRGLAHWRDDAGSSDAACTQRIFMGTNDGRQIALDGRTGEPCASFGAGGTGDLTADVGPQEWKGEYQVTSPSPARRDRGLGGR